MPWFRARRGKHPKRTQAESHVNSAYIRQAYDAWNWGICTPAENYLGRDFLKEMTGNTYHALNQIQSFSILGVLTEQKDVVAPLALHAMSYASEISEIGFRACELISTLRWSCDMVGLIQYKDCLTITIKAMKEPPASEAIQHLVTDRQRAGMDWFGTIEEPSRLVRREPVARLNLLLREMSQVATYRQFPSGNDLNWSPQEYDLELAGDFRFARFMLGLPTDREDPEADATIPTPEWFNGFPPQIDENARDMPYGPLDPWGNPLDPNAAAK